MSDEHSIILGRQGKVELRALIPGFVANESFDVKIHGNIFGRKNWNLQMRGQILLWGMNHMAFSLKHSLSKDHDCTYDCIIGGGNGEFNMRLHLFTARVHQ